MVASGDAEIVFVYSRARQRYFFGFAVFSFALLFVVLAATVSMFLTPLTPSTALATASALAFCSAVATDPLSVTTAFDTSTLIVESRRSLAAAKSKRVFVQSQPSLRPVPMLRPDLFILFVIFTSQRTVCVCLYVCIYVRHRVGVGVNARVRIVVGGLIASGKQAGECGGNDESQKLVSHCLAKPPPDEQFGKHTSEPKPATGPILAQKRKSIMQGFAESNGPETRGDSTKENYSKDWAKRKG